MMMPALPLRHTLLDCRYRFTCLGIAYIIDYHVIYYWHIHILHTHRGLLLRIHMLIIALLH